MNGGGSSNTAGKKGQIEVSKITKLETELKILKKERDEFFASRFDKVSNLSCARTFNLLSYPPADLLQ